MDDEPEGACADTRISRPPNDMTPSSPDDSLSRRTLLTGAAAAASGVMLAGVPVRALGQQGTGIAPAPLVPEDPTKVLGAATSPSSSRSPFVQLTRTPTGTVTGSSFSPIHELTGTITPTDLHFERHHGGVALIDPAKYKLLVHGLAERALVFSIDDIKSLPSVTRIHFLECAGNGRAGYKSPKAELSPQNIDGLISNAEWTGVPVRRLLAEVAPRREARWTLAEGGDAALVSRSIPTAKLLDDALLVYAQNGEPLRPAAGYPLRLLLPGWEGNTSIKWLRRLELISEPNMSKDETSKYTDPLPNDSARQFSFEMDAKSTITYPTFPARLAKPSWLQISGIAWSGRGRISSVDVSTDGGDTWTESELHAPALAKAVVRFTQMWRWNGAPATLMSRATDETGYTQPTFEAYRASRGAGTDYHYNYIRSWKVQPDGVVLFGVPS